MLEMGGILRGRERDSKRRKWEGGRRRRRLETAPAKSRARPATARPARWVLKKATQAERQAWVLKKAPRRRSWFDARHRERCGGSSHHRRAGSGLDEEEASGRTKSTRLLSSGTGGALLRRWTTDNLPLLFSGAGQRTTLSSSVVGRSSTGAASKGSIYCGSCLLEFVP
ncbi:uncharacterized protein LOC120110867 [Phoenix dactylifera]|uniref:Uncharacterized protein LOC113461117 n=1 Tax=Phoenix dactylifera TaxID=42345 RepID=A0A8B8J041_PHODC|nr:uncharacterized protein LOC113461117 [Phoenix dactylifera]XP_038982696.1 uncharacterized protein LOC120110867 [Phoenix dactylifera]